MQRLKLCISILTLLTLAGAILGWAYTHDQSLARASSVMVLRAEIQQIQLNGENYRKIAEAKDLERRIFELKLSYEGRQMPREIREYLFRMESDLRELRRK
jgi:hypothetical protein